MELKLQQGDTMHELSISGAEGEMRVRGTESGEEFAEFTAGVSQRDGSSFVVSVGEFQYRVRYWRKGGELFLHFAGRTTRVEALDPEDTIVDGADSSPVLRSPMPGKVLDVLASVGDSVEAGQPLVRLEAMKMEFDLVSPVSGVVATLPFTAGQLVDPDVVLATIEPAAE